MGCVLIAFCFVNVFLWMYAQMPMDYCEFLGIYLFALLLSFYGMLFAIQSKYKNKNRSHNISKIFSKIKNSHSCKKSFFQNYRIIKRYPLECAIKLFIVCMSFWIACLFLCLDNNPKTGLHFSLCSPTTVFLCRCNDLKTDTGQAKILISFLGTILCINLTLKSIRRRYVLQKRNRT